MVYRELLYCPKRYLPEEKKLKAPSLKDKGRTATTEQPKDKGITASEQPKDKGSIASEQPKDKGSKPPEQPKDKFKRVSMIPLGPSHKKLNKGYLSNPKPFILTERPKNFAPDAFQRLEPKPAEHLEILVPDTAKRPEPARENFNKSFYSLLVTSDKTMSLNIAVLEENLIDPRRGTKIGDRKYFPAVSTE